MQWHLADIYEYTMKTHSDMTVGHIDFLIYQTTCMCKRGYNNLTSSNDRQLLHQEFV